MVVPLSVAFLASVLVSLLGIVGLATGAGVTGYIAFADPGLTLAPTRLCAHARDPDRRGRPVGPGAGGAAHPSADGTVARSPGAGAMVVRLSALTARRRTAATAVPVLLTVGLAVSLLGAAATACWLCSARRCRTCVPASRA
ncbi:hypothetical protein [Phytohabitans kaempferiae]|uniref:Uncharacterized protein n=1 Tax=Phytohabitans kaempferiae TaxID=1620943 RepID=A0ABV6MBZ8_9ACTN